MAKVKTLVEMATYIMGLRDATQRGVNIAILEVVNAAAGEAKRNAVANFSGTADRPKTGNLANAIYAGFQELPGNPYWQGFVAVRSNKGRAGTRPYGRIHEYGGKIVPRRAKHLWIPIAGPKSSGVLGQFRDMTPTQFFDQGGFVLPRPGGGVGLLKVGGAIVPLFVLRKQVVIPERPYVRPAVADAVQRLPELVKRRVREQLTRGV